MQKPTKEAIDLVHMWECSVNGHKLNHVFHDYEPLGIFCTHCPKTWGVNTHDGGG